MKPLHLLQCRTVAGACVLMLAGLSPALAQFPPPPGQQQQQSANPFPPAPGQQRPASSPFPPAPGQASGGFGSPAQGGFGSPTQGGFGSPRGSFGSAPPQQGPSEAQKVCLTFPAIREDVEKGAATIRAAGDRKASRDEVCPLFKSFAVKEAKMVKFLETNRTLCGVPPNIITQIKTNHAKTIQIRNAVCSAAPAAAAGPTLSDALGGPIIADDSTARLPGRGTFDTLTGNALQR